MTSLVQLFSCLAIVWVVALPIGWLASESTSKRWLRLILGIASIVAFTLVAYNMGTLNGEFISNSYFAQANTRLINATVAELERGNSQAVLASLRQLQQQYHPNYENRSHFDQLVDEAVRNMQSTNATAPTAGQQTTNPATDR